MTRPIVTAPTEALDAQSSITVIPPPAMLPAISRRKFCQWGVAVAAGAVLLPEAGCSNVSGEALGENAAALGATDGPIYRKWIKLGGEAVVGAATSDRCSPRQTLSRSAL